MIASGGRVLNVTAQAPTLREAQARAYAAVDRIDWPEGFCRRDIGWRALGASRALTIRPGRAASEILHAGVTAV